jgi:hypothetical protein
MARVRLVSFLGTAAYDETDFVLEGKPAVTTPLLDHALCAWFEDVRGVVLLGTSEVQTQWIDSGAWAQATARTPAFRRIPPAVSPEAGWKIFEEVRAALSLAPIADAGEDAPPEEIVVNLTHGYRPQAIFGVAALQFVLSEWAREGDGRGVPLRLLYGAYEKGTRPTPVWDVTSVLFAARWNAALDALMRFGRADDLAQLARTTDADAAALGEAARAFTDDLSFVRVPSLLRVTAPRLRDTLRAESTRRFLERLPAIRGTVEALGRWVEPLCPPNVTGPEGFRAVQHMAALYGRLARFAEQAAVIREGLVTGFASVVSDASPKEPDDTGFKRERKRFDEDGLSKLKQKAALPDGDLEAQVRAAFFTARDPRAALAFVRLASDVHDRRNDVLHAGMRSDARSATALRAAFEDLLQRFQALGAGAREAEPARERPRRFLNLSNYPLARWPAEQLTAARALGLGEPADLEGGLPDVDPDANEAALAALARDVVRRAVEQGAAGAFVATDYAVTVALVVELQRRGVRCFAAANRRDVTDLPDEGGARARRLVHHFIRFREYPRLG